MCRVYRSRIPEIIRGASQYSLERRIRCTDPDCDHYGIDKILGTISGPSIEAVHLTVGFPHFELLFQNGHIRTEHGSVYQRDFSLREFLDAVEGSHSMNNARFGDHIRIARSAFKSNGISAVYRDGPEENYMIESVYEFDDTGLAVVEPDLITEPLEFQYHDMTR